MLSHLKHTCNRFSTPIALGIAIIMIATVSILFSGVLSPAHSTTSSLPREHNMWAQQHPTEVKSAWAIQNITRLVNTSGAPVATDGEKIFRIDSNTGDHLWEYHVDGAVVCDITDFQGDVMAVYNKNGAGCGSYIILNAQSGEVEHTAHYGEPSDVAALVSQAGHTAVVYPTRVRVVRNDLVTTSEFGNSPYPIADTDQVYTGCTISDVSLNNEKYAVASTCTVKKNNQQENTYSIKILQLVPEESTQGIEVMNSINTGVDDPATIPIMTKAMIGFVRGGNDPAFYSWELTKSQQLVAKTFITPGTYGFPYQDFEGIGYVWRVGEQTMLRHGSEDITNPYTLDGTIGSASRSDNNLLIPQHGAIVVWNPMENIHDTIRAEGLTGTQFGFAGNTFMALSAGVLTGYQPK